LERIYEKEEVMIKEFLVESARVARTFWKRQAVVLSLHGAVMVVVYYQAFVRKDFIDLIVSAFSVSPVAGGELVFLGVLLVVL
jgi:hypothetical protein